ncbi:hypothetical protein BB561_000209 [Smittium simulii]|uniref:Pacifastin domain-containing protein n=1 Tax=Smittium simulii TaxID=133385 RepID=A0A2T9Z016_9FUNG|nr:hypothetical protein BB561_000209 [Smittium simulii]
MLKYIVLFCFIIISTLVVSQESYDCVRKYGRRSFKSPYDSCNTCKCGRMNKIFCTKKVCPRPQIDSRIVYLKCIRRYGSGLFRSPYDSCNKCKCGIRENLTMNHAKTYITDLKM